MVTVLFEDRPRTRMEPLGRGEGLFEFDSCARPGYDEFRSIVNAPSESGAVVGGRTVTLTLDMSTAVTADTSGGLPTLVLNDGGRRPMTPTPRPRRPAQRDLLDKGGAGADWSKHNRHPLINKGDTIVQKHPEPLTEPDLTLSRQISYGPYQLDQPATF